MRMRWLAMSGVALIVVALMLQTLGPRLWPVAYWGPAANSAMMGPSGMMSPGGMMGGGMMGSGGMMGAGAVTDPNAPFDLRWVDTMIMHHQGAVMSAQMMIADSARPELRDLAQRIMTTQQQEIDQMRQWRSTWYPDAPTLSGGMGMMGSGMMVGGMMNRDQMRQMMGANVDFDQMFLQMMIPHHEAAITMAEQALTQAEHPEIKGLAQAIIAAQRAEITEMQGYLRDQ